VQITDSNTDIKASTTLDAKGLNCPLPILKTKQALKGMPTGEILRILTTDPGSKADFAAFCNQTGHQLVSSGEDGGTYEFNIRKN
jgi:tRNA 2-thiouridine synthesizing protein A